LDGVTFGDNITLLGCGSSHFATIFAMHFFKMLKNFKKVLALEASEIVQEDFQDG
jgi:fructoselysine-6-P-deglycase FrlB-like protein